MPLVPWATVIHSHLILVAVVVDKYVQLILFRQSPTFSTYCVSFCFPPRVWRYHRPTHWARDLEDECSSFPSTGDLNSWKVFCRLLRRFRWRGVPAAHRSSLGSPGVGSSPSSSSFRLLPHSCSLGLCLKKTTQQVPGLKLCFWRNSTWEKKSSYYLYSKLGFLQLLYSHETSV